MRHIPATPTAKLNILPFGEALREMGGSDYDRDRWLYVPDFYTEYRYILGTRGQRPLICIGVNPSTARPGALDRTLQSVERLARFNGFDSFIMLNVYAQRATLPSDLETDMNPALHRENMEALRHALSISGGVPTLWAAWGTVITQRPWLKDCVADMIRVGEEAGARWVKAGPCSKAGHPHHPLYLKGDTVLEDYDIRAYVASLNTNGR